MSRPTKGEAKRDEIKKSVYGFYGNFFFHRCSFWLRSWLTCFILHGFFFRWGIFVLFGLHKWSTVSIWIIVIVLNNNTIKHHKLAYLHWKWTELSETKDEQKKRNKKFYFSHFFRFHEFVPPFSIILFYSSFAQFRIQQWSRTGGLSESMWCEKNRIKFIIDQKKKKNGEKTAIQLCQIMIFNSSQPFNPHD